MKNQNQRSYKPDVSLPNNQEKLKKMAVIARQYPDRGLLPVLEGLVETGKEDAAHTVIFV